jgi:hypothetical protein
MWCVCRSIHSLTVFPHCHTHIHAAGFDERQEWGVLTRAGDPHGIHTQTNGAYTHDAGDGARKSGWPTLTQAGPGADAWTGTGWCTAVLAAHSLAASSQHKLCSHGHGTRLLTFPHTHTHTHARALTHTLTYALTRHHRRYLNYHHHLSPPPQQSSLTPSPLSLFASCVCVSGRAASAAPTSTYLTASWTAPSYR